MINGINNINNYYNVMFKNPFNSTQITPTTAFVFSAGITAMYSETINTQLSSTMSTFLTSFEDKLSNLEASANSLNALLNEEVSTKKVESSDESVLVKSVSNDAKEQTYSLGVQNLAKTQVNSSNQFESSSYAGFSTGDNTFQISQGEETFDVTVNVKSYYDNNRVLQETRDAINSSGAGVFASIYTTDDGNSFLKIESDETGVENGFDITGDFASQLGIDSVEREAEDAVYTVDGEEFTSATNDIEIDDGNVQLTLVETTETDVLIEVEGTEQDVEDTFDSLSEFVEAYNSAVGFFEENTSNSEINTLRGELEAAVSSERFNLEKIGIELSGDRLYIDRDKFEEAVSVNPNVVSEVLSETDIASEVEDIVEEVNEKTLSVFFADQLTNSSSNQFEFSNYNYFQSNAILNYQSTGNLFDAAF